MEFWPFCYNIHSILTTHLLQTGTILDYKEQIQDVSIMWQGAIKY